MPENITPLAEFRPLNLYHADENPAILVRQNGRYTHSFTIPIKSAGTMLVLLRSKEEITDESLENMIRAGNQVSEDFDIVYYQTVVGCDLGSNTLLYPKDNTEHFTESIRLTYRTNITAPANLPTDQADLFVANSLASRASRQTSRTMETLELSGIEADNVGENGETDNFVTLVFLAAQNKNGEGAYIFTLEEGEAHDGEGSDNETIRNFLNGETDPEPVAEVQILGYFPKDQPDFDAFVEQEFTITINGNAALSVARVSND